MSDSVSLNTIPSIAPMFRFQWEEAQDCYVILYPEGMVKLSQSAGEILQRCDGERAVADIIATLGDAFPGVDLSNDVKNFLETAHANGWIKLTEPE